MKFYKRKPIDQHNPIDSSWAVNSDGTIVTNANGSMEVPSGNTGQRPTSTVDGQMRYNTTLNEDEAHINGVWERIRTVRPSTIIVQNLGSGNYLNTYFGPLNPDYEPSYAKSSANIMVYVDNVYQIPEYNYSLTLTSPADFQISTSDNVGIGSSTIPLSTLTNVLVGMTVSGSSALQANTTVASIDSSSTSIVLSLQTVDNIPSSTSIDFTYTTGTYINFSGPVPMKPVIALFGFDGYFPPA
jgi:hypothetical protein